MLSAGQHASNPEYSRVSSTPQGSGVVSRAVLGCHPGVGVAGLTLGGGLGWLLGKHGAACDHLMGADLITAEGRFIRASETENRDLLWALRGGGGNFGVVTALDFRLHPLNQVLGGILVLRTDIARFLRFYVSFMKAAPDELTAELTLVRGNPPVVIAMVCWSGEAGRGERVLMPLRSLTTPVADWIDRVPYAHLTSRMREVPSLLGAHGADGCAPQFSYWKGGSVHHLSSECSDEIAAVLERAPTGCSIGLGHYMHGQICRVARDATPLIRKAGQMTYFLSASWASQELAERPMQWVAQSFAAMQPFSIKGAYVNYLSANDESEIKAAYSDNYQRLAELKKRYDPSNVFHCNRNIRPAT
jgi:FAD/FMN-containing dehydrogenase